MVTILQGDCREVLKTFPEGSVNCCVTSPPYYGLRDYGVDGQIGLEKTPDSYVTELVAVFAQVRRVLRDDGTLWINLGDSYCTSAPNGMQGKNGGRKDRTFTASGLPCKNGFGMKPKDLIGIPWMVAFALRADGWYLRQDIIWHKPNTMPESVTDRCTKAHEYVFLMSKSATYHCDMEAIKDPVAQSTVERLAQDVESQTGSDRVPFKTNGNMKAVGNSETRNKRSVWTVNTKPYKGSHFATFPPSLIRPMIIAGCPIGGTVIDPFGGSGTTGQVSEEEGRNAVLIELNPEYIKLQEQRTAQMGLFCA